MKIEWNTVPEEDIKESVIVDVLRMFIRGNNYVVCPVTTMLWILRQGVFLKVYYVLYLADVLIFSMFSMFSFYRGLGKTFLTYQFL